MKKVERKRTHIRETGNLMILFMFQLAVFVSRF